MFIYFAYPMVFFHIFQLIKLKGNAYGLGKIREKEL